MEIKNKIVLVTGSTRGIGKTIAELFCKKGAFVYINSSKSIQEGEELEKELISEGCKAKYIQGDISLEKDVKRIFETIKKEKGKLDILVNNAGIYLDSDIKGSKNYSDYEFFHKINGFGNYLCTIYAGELINKGKIINVSSIYAIKPNQDSILASGVKTEVETYTRAFAQKFKGRIEVNSVAPGYTNTSLVHKNISKKNLQKIIKQTSQKRLIQPEEIANAVLFLIENDSITGQTIVIDNGTLL